MHISSVGTIITSIVMIQRFEPATYPTKSGCAWCYAKVLGYRTVICAATVQQQSIILHVYQILAIIGRDIRG